MHLQLLTISAWMPWGAARQSSANIDTVSWCTCPCCQPTAMQAILLWSYGVAVHMTGCVAVTLHLTMQTRTHVACVEQSRQEATGAVTVAMHQLAGCAAATVQHMQQSGSSSGEHSENNSRGDLHDRSIDMDVDHHCAACHSAQPAPTNSASLKTPTESRPGLLQPNLDWTAMQDCAATGPANELPEQDCVARDANEQPYMMHLLTQLHASLSTLHAC